MKNAPNIVMASTGGTSRRLIDSCEVLADALEVEHRLGEDRAAAEHGAEVQPPQRDDRDQRVAQHVAAQHASLAEMPLARAVRT